MTRRSVDWFSLWAAPFEMARTAAIVGETAMHSQAVIAARMPTLCVAFWNPWAADHRELQLMVSEKVGAARRSARSASASAALVRRAANGQAAAFVRIGGGAIPTPVDWWTMAERATAIAASLVMLPGQMLQPFHAGVTANAKRLAPRRGPI